MAINDINIRGESQTGSTIATVRDGSYLYPDGDIKFGHSFPARIAVFVETTPGLWLQIWTGEKAIVGFTIYNLRANVFPSPKSWHAAIVGIHTLKIYVAELDAPGGVIVDEWEAVTPIEVTIALPAISSYYTEMTPNYLFDTEEFLIATRITEMDADSHVMLHLNSKMFLMGTSDDLNYSAIVPASDVGTFMLKKWEIIAIGPGGTVVFPAAAVDFKWIGIVDYSRKVVLLEGWTDDESVDDWNIVGDEIYTSWSSNKMLYIYIPCNVIEEQYLSQDIHKMNANIPWEFNVNIGMSSSLTEDAALYIGLFGNSDDLMVIKNLIGLKKYVESGVHQLALVIIDEDGVVQTQKFADPLEDFGDDILYTVKVIWNPENFKLTASLYKTDDDEELALVESIEIKTTVIPDMEVDRYGVHYDYAATDIWERIYFGSTMLKIGNVDQSIHKVVDDLEVNSGETTDTDLQVLMHYYDFTTGETLVADDDLTVDILNSEKEIVTTIPAVQREDGKYEAFWSTVGVPTDTYLVKVTGSLSGRIKVTKQLVSVENE